MLALPMPISRLLAAHLNGWAPVSILDAHELSHQCDQVSRFAMRHAARSEEHYAAA
jgi:hypothetical protein